MEELSAEKQKEIEEEVSGSGVEFVIISILEFFIKGKKLSQQHMQSDSFSFKDDINLNLLQDYDIDTILEKAFVLFKKRFN